MIKKQRKWIALFVALTFMWLLQVSTMPVVAAGANEQISTASSEQGPDFVEAVSHKVAPAPKHSILPLVLIGVGVAAVAAVLILVVSKTSYDIVGTWEFVYHAYASYTYTYKVIFTGSKTSGNFVYQSVYNSKGSYTVHGKNVTMVFSDDLKAKEPMSGKFTGKDTMSGTFADPSSPYTWTATRAAAAAAVNTTPETQSMLFPK